MLWVEDSIRIVLGGCVAFAFLLRSSVISLGYLIIFFILFGILPPLGILADAASHFHNLPNHHLHRSFVNLSLHNVNSKGTRSLHDVLKFNENTTPRANQSVIANVKLARIRSRIVYCICAAYGACVLVLSAIVQHLTGNFNVDKWISEETWSVIGVFNHGSFNTVFLPEVLVLGASLIGIVSTLLGSGKNVKYRVRPSVDYLKKKFRLWLVLLLICMFCTSLILPSVLCIPYAFIFVFALFCWAISGRFEELLSVGVLSLSSKKIEEWLLERNRILIYQTFILVISAYSFIHICIIIVGPMIITSERTCDFMGISRVPSAFVGSFQFYLPLSYVFVTCLQFLSLRTLRILILLRIVSLEDKSNQELQELRKSRLSGNESENPEYKGRNIFTRHRNFIKRSLLSKKSGRALLDILAHVSSSSCVLLLLLYSFLYHTVHSFVLGICVFAFKLFLGDFFVYCAPILMAYWSIAWSMVYVFSIPNLMDPNQESIIGVSNSTTSHPLIVLMINTIPLLVLTVLMRIVGGVALFYLNIDKCTEHSIETLIKEDDQFTFNLLCSKQFEKLLEMRFYDNRSTILHLTAKLGRPNFSKVILGKLSEVEFIKLKNLESKSPLELCLETQSFMNTNNILYFVCAIGSNNLCEESKKKFEDIRRSFTWRFLESFLIIWEYFRGSSYYIVLGIAFVVSLDSLGLIYCLLFILFSIFICLPHLGSNFWGIFTSYSGAVAFLYYGLVMFSESGSVQLPEVLAIDEVDYSTILPFATVAAASLLQTNVLRRMNQEYDSFVNLNALIRMVLEISRIPPFGVRFIVAARSFVRSFFLETCWMVFLFLQVLFFSNSILGIGFLVLFLAILSSYIFSWDDSSIQLGRVFTLSCTVYSGLVLVLRYVAMFFIVRNFFDSNLDTLGISSQQLGLENYNSSLLSVIGINASLVVSGILHLLQSSKSIKDPHVNDGIHTRASLFIPDEIRPILIAFYHKVLKEATLVNVVVIFCVCLTLTPSLLNFGLFSIAMLMLVVPHGIPNIWLPVYIFCWCCIFVQYVFQINFENHVSEELQKWFGAPSDVSNWKWDSLLSKFLLIFTCLLQRYSGIFLERYASNIDQISNLENDLHRQSMTLEVSLDLEGAIIDMDMNEELSMTIGTKKSLPERGSSFASILSAILLFLFTLVDFLIWVFHISASRTSLYIMALGCVAEANLLSLIYVLVFGAIYVSWRYLDRSSSNNFELPFWMAYALSLIVTLCFQYIVILGPPPSGGMYSWANISIDAEQKRFLLIGNLTLSGLWWPTFSLVIMSGSVQAGYENTDVFINTKRLAQNSWKFIRSFLLVCFQHSHRFVLLFVFILASFDINIVNIFYISTSMVLSTKSRAVVKAYWRHLSLINMIMLVAFVIAQNPWIPYDLSEFSWTRVIGMERTKDPLSAQGGLIYVIVLILFDLQQVVFDSSIFHDISLLDDILTLDAPHRFIQGCRDFYFCKISQSFSNKEILSSLRKLDNLFDTIHMEAHGRSELDDAEVWLKGTSIRKTSVPFGIELSSFNSAAIFISKETGLIAEANDLALALTDYTILELNSLTPFELFHSRAHLTLHECLKKAYAFEHKSTLMFSCRLLVQNLESGDCPFVKCVVLSRKNVKDAIIGAVIIVEESILYDGQDDDSSQSAPDYGKNLVDEYESPAMCINDDLMIFDWNEAIELLTNSGVLSKHFNVTKNSIALCHELSAIFEFSNDAEKEKLELSIHRVINNPEFDRLKISGKLLVKNSNGSQPVEVVIKILPAVYEGKNCAVLLISCKYLKMRIFTKLKIWWLKLKKWMNDYIDSNLFFLSPAVQKIIKRKLPFINIQWLKKNDSFTEVPFVLLLWQFFQSQAELVCFGAIFLNLLLQHSILDLVIPIYCLMYGLLESIPLGHGFWTFNEVYMVILVLLRYFVQLDLFCTDSLGNWLVAPSADCVPVSSSAILGYRKDRLIGLYQAQSQTRFISTILPQFFVLVTISFVKRTLKCKGVWDFTVDDLPRSQNRVYFEKYYRHLRRGKKTVVWLLFQILPKAVCGYFYRLIPMTIRGKTEHRLKPGQNYYSVYAFIQIICIFYSFLFYSLMTSNSNSITSLSSNYFSGEMVLFVFTLIGIVVLDRVAFLSKSNLLKLILHYFCVSYICLLIFFYWPEENDVSFEDNPALIFFCLMQLSYFFFSALQIRHGFRQLERHYHTITQDTQILNKILVIMYKQLPLFFEIRTVLDWTCVRSCINLAGTFEVEDIYFKMFALKSDIIDGRSQLRGNPKTTFEKFRNGFIVFICLMLIVLGPMLLFSSANPTTQTTVVTGAIVELTAVTTVGTFQLLSISSVSQITTVSAGEYDALKNTGLVTDQPLAGVQRVIMSPDTDSIWTISPSRKSSLITVLGNSQNGSTSLLFSYKFTKSGPSSALTGSGQTSTSLTSYDAQSLSTLLNPANISLQNITIRKLFPTLISLPASKSTADIASLTQLEASSANLVINSDSSEQTWFSLQNVSNSSHGITFVTISTPYVSNDLLSLIGSTQIFAVYIFVFFTIGAYVRSFLAQSASDIPLNHLLDVTLIMEICEGIYIARSTREFEREETLYVKLIRLFRDPGLLIKFTRRDLAAKMD